MLLQRILRLTLFWFLADGLWTVNAEENKSSENISIEADNEDMDSTRRNRRGGRSGRRERWGRGRGPRTWRRN